MHSDLSTKVEKNISLNIFRNFLLWSEELYAMQCEPTRRCDHGRIDSVGFWFAVPNRLFPAQYSETSCCVLDLDNCWFQLCSYFCPRYLRVCLQVTLWDCFEMSIWQVTRVCVCVLCSGYQRLVDRTTESLHWRLMPTGLHLRVATQMNFAKK